jgi:hypothetical protein
MAKSFAEYARERDEQRPEERERVRVFEAYYAGLTPEEILALAVEDDVDA